MPDPTEPTDTQQAAARPRSKRRVLGCLLAALIGVVLVLGGVAVAIALYAKPFVEQRIVKRARERGFELEVGRLELGWSRVDLREVDVRLVGVRGVSARLDTVSVALERFEPVDVVVDGAAVKLEGSAPTLALDLAQWARTYPADHPDAYQGSLKAQGVHVVWRDVPEHDPWLRLQGGVIEPTDEGGTLVADQAVVAGVKLGRVAASWTSTEAVVDLGFGAKKTSESPVRIVVQHGARPAMARFTLDPTPLHRLSEPLGVELPIDEDVKLGGDAELTLPPAFERGAMEGRIALTLDGYVPPHPVELSGFVFGDTTTVTSRLAVSADRQTIALDETSLTAGKFVLTGEGEITRYESHAIVKVGLRGDLPCSALANAAAHSRLGRELGKVVGPAASKLVEGSVAVVVKLRADTRNLAGAKVLRTIGVGCGLKPIEIPGVGTIDLGDIKLDDINLDELPELPSGIPSSLPPLPSSLPPLPAPEDFRFPPLAPPEPDRVAPAPPPSAASE